MIDLLQPGDCLIYRPTSVFGWIVALKTWTKASHVEGYWQNGYCIGARSAGVNYWPLELTGLARVRRPAQPFNVAAASEWFAAKARGQKYDWAGLLCFTLAKRQGSPSKMFCSELLTRWYRAGGFQPFNPQEDADHIAPAQFVQAAPFTEVWSDGKPI